MKQSYSAEKRRRGDSLGILIIQLGAENQNNQRILLCDMKKFREKHSHGRKNSKTKPSSKKKAFKPMVPQDGILEKHPRLLSSSVRRPKEIR